MRFPRSRARVETVLVSSIAVIAALVPGRIWATTASSAPPTTAAVTHVATPKTPEAVAKATGKRVVIPTLTTANSQTYANPDGTRTLEMNVKPVRQRAASGAWVPITPVSAPHSALAATPAAPIARAAVSTPPGETGWAEVYGKALAANHYWGGDGDSCGCAKVGVAYGANQYLVRSYFQFGIGGLAGKNIDSAKIVFDEVYAPSCTLNEPTQVDMYNTSAIDSSLSWNSQSSMAFNLLGSATVAYGYSSACPANTISTDAMSAITYGLGNGSNAATFMLQAHDETTSLAQYSWKKFTTNPTLTVTYDSSPDLPSNVSQGVSGSTGTNGTTPCVTHANAPYISTTTPSLNATITDADSGPLVQGDFQYWIAGTSTMLGEKFTGFAGSGAPLSVQVDPGKYADGSDIAWRVRGINDSGHAGPWTVWCEAYVDQTPPSAPPTVTSSVYNEAGPGSPGSFSGGVGETAPFTFTANGVPDVAGFLYCLGANCAPTTYVAANQLGGGATANITPTTYRDNDLYVRSVDRAGNPGPMYASAPGEGYHFLVNRGAPAVGIWHLDNFGPPTTAPDGSGNHFDGTVSSSGAYWTAGRLNEAIHVDGGSGAVTTAGPVLNTSQSLTVSAWVKLDRTGPGAATFVSQDGSQDSGFYLQYRGDRNAWAFMMVDSDITNPTEELAVASTQVQTGAWTHLVGQYDAGAGQLKIFVNGHLAGTAAHTATWNSTGPLVIGRAKFSGTPTDFVPGAIDEVRVYQRVLAVDQSAGDGSDDIHDLATGNATQQAFLPLNEGSGTNAEDQSGNYYNGTLSGGATWTHGHASLNAVHFDEATGQIATSAPVVRTDNSFTVSAEVKLDKIDGNWQTLVSEDGQHASLFALQYSPITSTTGHWSFTVAPSDVLNPSWQTVYSGVVPQAGVWTQVTGYYDAAAQTVGIYVDGANGLNMQAVVSQPQGAGMTGNLVIGRGRQNDTNLAYLGGAIDDVRVYAGVASPDQINADFNQENLHNLQVPNNYPNELTSYFLAGVGHFTTAGPVPPSYYAEGQFGMLALSGAPNTTVLYSCSYISGQFVSADSGCEGNHLLGTIGSVYTTAPAGIPTKAIYRCLVVSNGDHFVAEDPNCYSNSNYRVEGQLGYVVAYVALDRFLKTDAPADHATAASTLLVSPGAAFTYSLANYPFEKTLGLLSLTSSGDVPVYTCINGTDEYIVTGSTNNCGNGTQSINWIGNMWSTPPQATATAQLFDCKTTATGERFDSTDPACESQTVIGSLGYVITQP